jgi:hypothetical protein
MTTLRQAAQPTSPGAQATSPRDRRAAHRRGWPVPAALVGAFQFVPRLRRHHRMGIAGAIFGTGELRMDVAKGAGWVITLAVAECAIRRPARPLNRRHSRSTTTTHSAPVGAPT